MGKSEVDDDLKVVEALKANLVFLMHLDTLRIRLATVYMVAMMGVGFAAIGSESETVQKLGASLGLLVTMFCWFMTHKWNYDFVDKVSRLDDCSQQLVLENNTKLKNIHDLLPFPVRNPKLRIINVRLMFHLLYGTFALSWVILLGLILLDALQ